MPRALTFGWKVLKNGHSSNIGRLKYEVGKWTYPFKGNGPLCVFSTQNAAVDFVDSYINCSSYTIHRCLYEKSDEREVWRGCSRHEDISYLPDGKVLAKRVLILPE